MPPRLSEKSRHGAHQTPGANFGVNGASHPPPHDPPLSRVGYPTYLISLTMCFHPSRSFICRIVSLRASLNISNAIHSGRHGIIPEIRWLSWNRVFIDAGAMNEPDPDISQEGEYMRIQLPERTVQLSFPTSISKCAIAFVVLRILHRTVVCTGG